MALRLDGRDVSGFKFLFSLAVMYGLMSILVHSVMYTKFITPLGIDAPLDRFSEARAIEHVRVLAHEIDGRQVRLLISFNFLSIMSCTFFFLSILLDSFKSLFFLLVYSQCLD